MYDYTQECNKLEFPVWLVSYEKRGDEYEIKNKRLGMITKDNTTIKLYVYEEGENKDVSSN